FKPTSRSTSSSITKTRFMARSAWFEADGKQDPESAAAARFAVDEHAAAVCAGDVVDDRQAQSEPGRRVVAGRRDAMELVEDPPHLGRRDADAAIGHLDDAVLVIAAHGEGEKPGAVRILDGIADQIADDGLELLGVADDAHGAIGQRHFDAE